MLSWQQYDRIKVPLSAITDTSNNNLFVVLAMFLKKDLERQMCFLGGRRWIRLRRHWLKSFMFGSKGRSFTIWAMEMWSTPLQTQINRSRYWHIISYLYTLVPNSWNGSSGWGLVAFERIWVWHTFLSCPTPALTPPLNLILSLQDPTPKIAFFYLVLVTIAVKTFLLYT